MTVTLSLPFPPSANRLWRNVGGKTLKSAAYRAWLTEALWSIKAQHGGKVEGAYHLSIVATAPDRRRRDLGNLEKAISDSLVQAGVISDDHLAQSIHAQWHGEPVKGGELTVFVRAAE